MAAQRYGSKKKTGRVRESTVVEVGRSDDMQLSETAGVKSKERKGESMASERVNV